MTPVRLIGGFLVLVAIGIGAVTVIAAVIRGEAVEPLGTLELPAPGEVRPDYLADGTPVWIVRHDDGDVDVLSGFDTHRPSNIGKILWWCERAKAFENPEHGSRYDEFGLKIGGPAPTGLPAYTVSVEGNRAVVGALQAAPPPDAPHSGAADFDRQWCNDPEHARIFHTFEDWEAWDSPTAAAQAAPDGWILLQGELALRGGAVVVCGARGCADDSVVAANIDPTDAEREFGPLFGDRFIAQVHDGVLTGVTRVMPSNADDPPAAEPEP